MICEISGWSVATRSSRGVDACWLIMGIDAGLQIVYVRHAEWRLVTKPCSISRGDTFCIYAVGEHLMATQALAPKEQGAQMQGGQVGFRDPPYTINASVRVRAETRRIFQAVVVPEYLEAWLSIPEDGILWAITPLQHGVGFALNWCNANATRSRIVAFYSTCKRRKLTIGWRLEKNDLPRESIVIMRISGDFGWSILSLFHVGFRTFDEFAWHRQLWGASLERLAKLF